MPKRPAAMAAALDGGGLFPVLSPDETALDVMHRSHKTAAHTGMPLLEPVSARFDPGSCQAGARSCATPS